MVQRRFMRLIVAREIGILQSFMERPRHAAREIGDLVTIRSSGARGTLLANGVVALMAIIASASVLAMDYHARAMLGGYGSRESFTNTSDPTSDGSTSNNAAIASARFFLDARRLGDDEWRCVVDLRDKNDFFDKMDRERLELTSRNDFQTRQAWVGRDNEAGLFHARAGRFGVMEAGYRPVDGVEIGLHDGRSARVGLFGGWDPWLIDQTYYQHDPMARVTGVYVGIAPEPSSDVTVSNRVAINNAIAANTYGTAMDRVWWHHDSLWQWNAGGRVSASADVDAIPTRKLQNGRLDYDQWFLGGFRSVMVVSRWDAIQYRRERDIREWLKPSPYDEARWTLGYRPAAYLTLETMGRIGRRSYDAKLRREIAPTVRWRRLGGPWTASTTLGYERGFVATRQYARLTGGYERPSWELLASTERAIERNDDDGGTTNPVISELSISGFPTRSLVLTAGGQYAIDERVSIASAFVSVATRWSNRESLPRVGSRGGYRGVWP